MIGRLVYVLGWLFPVSFDETHAGTNGYWLCPVCDGRHCRGDGPRHKGNCMSELKIYVMGPREDGTSLSTTKTSGSYTIEAVKRIAGEKFMVPK